MSKVFGLLVGINNYPPSIRPLSGCINDIEAFENFLKVRISNDKLNLKVLKDNQATREAIIENFENHLSLATSDDVVIFYFCGHGASNPAPPELWHLAANKKFESLVCYETANSSRDIADKELGALIAKVSGNAPEKAPHIVVILDCCHSGSGTRAFWGETVGIRTTGPEKERIVDAFYGVQNIENIYSFPEGKHLLLAACRDLQTSKETYFGGKKRGVFSYSLGRVLEKSKYAISYRDLIHQVHTKVQNLLINDQNPILETHFGADRDGAFLSGTVQDTPNYFSLSRIGDTWKMDGGAIHGLRASKTDPNNRTELVLYKIDENEFEETNIIGKGWIESVLSGESRIKIENEDSLTDENYKAIIVKNYIPKAKVFLDFKGMKENDQKIFIKKLTNSLFLERVENIIDSDYQVNGADFSICHSFANQLLVAPLKDSPSISESINKTILRLEHMNRWQQTLELENPTSKLNFSDFAIDFFNENGTPLKKDSLGDYTLIYGEDDSPPKIKIRITNNSNQQLHFALVGNSVRYNISAKFFPSYTVELRPKEHFYAFDEKAIPLTIPDNLYNDNLNEIVDFLKLIVSTSNFDVQLLEQGPLDVQVNRSELVTRGDWTSLENRLKGVSYRDYDLNYNHFDDWTCINHSFRVIRPLKKLELKAETKEKITLLRSLSVVNESKMVCNIRLSSDEQHTRSIDAALIRPIPEFLLNNPEFIKPISFTQSRGNSSGLNSIILENINHIDAITKENPLIFNFEEKLEEGESILVIADNGEHFIPILTNYSDGVNIHGLPLPSSNENNDRGLLDPIKLMFWKVVDKYKGQPKPANTYNSLSVLNIVGDSSNFTYSFTAFDCNQRAALKVNNIKKVILFIHGILGNTEAILTEMLDSKKANVLVDNHFSKNDTMILVYNYENLNTSISIIADALSQSLLGINDCEHYITETEWKNKEVVIVAHSMGGLVSRYFIEKLQGGHIVDKLIMLGTPNNGSPFPSLKSWIGTLLGFGLNGLGCIFPPAIILGSLVSAFNKESDVALMDMKIGSDFLMSLNNNKTSLIDRNYFIAAGNTNNITYTPIDGNVIKRYIHSVFSMQTTHTTLTTYMFKKPNDMAVSVESIKKVPSLNVHFVEVACNHITYFVTLEVIDWLDKNL